MNKVKITICGIDYVIAGNEDEEYVLNLARKLDAELKKMMAQNPRISVMTAAVLAALDHLDESVKARELTPTLSSRASIASARCSYPPARWAISRAISGESAEKVSSSQPEGSSSPEAEARSSRLFSLPVVKKQGFSGLCGYL